MKLINGIKNFFKGFVEGVKNYRKNTKEMSFSEKLGYIKDYYLRDAIVLGIVLVCIISLLATSYINRHTDYLLFGVSVNVDLSTAGTEYIVDKFFETQKTGGRQKIDFSCVTIDDFSTTNDADASYYSAQSVIAQVSAKRLDYIITDEVGFQFFAGQELYMDLREMLTPAELEEWADRIIYVQEEESDEMFPTGLNITNTEFIKNNNPKGGEVYLAFAGNAPNKERAYEFFHYILKYKPEK